MLFCRNCSKEVNEKAHACTSCGLKPNDGNQYCRSCGKETNPKAVICVACGVSLESNSILGNLVVGESGGEPNDAPVSSGTAILWFLCCYPIGFSQWGQTAKGWVWVLAAFITGGFAGIVALVDYVMCYQAQKVRKLKEWEFFPSA
tara:strand:+ start:186 stop:623 length:438 start_codon:yes stop_codon:yes gene_type:complete